MKFAILGHLDYESRLKELPKNWIKEDLIISPEFDFLRTKGYFLALKLTAQQLMTMSKEEARQLIVDAAVFAQNELDVELVQLGGLTTSVTSGGEWLTEQKNYSGFVNHGDSYTAAVACQTVLKTLNMLNKKPSELKLAIVGAYGIIGEALSKILVPEFAYSILIGRQKEKLQELTKRLKGDFTTSTNLETKSADVVITATSHHTALLTTNHLKKQSIIVDVSQPVNLSKEVCESRTDICRVDGGYVDLPETIPLKMPGMPKGKLFSCIVEVIMQAMEDERRHHVGSIDLKYLRQTERRAEKYGFNLKTLTNFGIPIAQQIR